MRTKILICILGLFCATLTAAPNISPPIPDCHELEYVAVDMDITCGVFIVADCQPEADKPIPLSTCGLIFPDFAPSIVIGTHQGAMIQHQLSYLTDSISRPDQTIAIVATPVPVLYASSYPNRWNVFQRNILVPPNYPVALTVCHILDKYPVTPLRITSKCPVPPNIYGMYLKSRTSKAKRHV